jgi:hypothetical protein
MGGRGCCGLVLGLGLRLGWERGWVFLDEEGRGEGEWTGKGRGRGCGGGRACGGGRGAVRGGGGGGNECGVSLWRWDLMIVGGRGLVR